MHWENHRFITVHYWNDLSWKKIPATEIDRSQFSRHSITFNLNNSVSMALSQCSYLQRHLQEHMILWSNMRWHLAVVLRTFQWSSKQMSAQKGVIRGIPFKNSIASTASIRTQCLIDLALHHDRLSFFFGKVRVKSRRTNDEKEWNLLISMKWRMSCTNCVYRCWCWIAIVNNMRKSLFANNQEKIDK